MTALKPRNRVVVFRLTSDEYICLRDACNRKGGRNLSEFTRAELMERLETEALGRILNRRFNELERRLSDLHLALELVRQSVEGTAVPLPETGSPLEVRP